METNYQKIYEQLGRLFYAIAASDGTIKEAEIARLRDIVRQYWKPLEGTVDESTTDAAHYILIVFDRHLAEGMSPFDAYHSFAEYYVDHEPAFTSAIKHRISDTACSLAHAFNGLKSEKGYLNKLHELLTDTTLVNQVHG